MIRFNGLLSSNSCTNGGEFVQPHFQKRKICDISSSKHLWVVIKVHDQPHTCSPLLSPILSRSKFIFLSNSNFGEYIYMYIDNIYCHCSTIAVYAKIYLAISGEREGSDEGLMNKGLKLILD